MRKCDLLTGAEDLVSLTVFKDFPVFMGTTTSDSSDDVLADMEWCISVTSGIIHLKEPLPLELLYQSQTTNSAVGSIWKFHHSSFASFIHEYSPVGVLEVGGAHGILSVEYKAFNNIPWTIVEPNPSPVAECTANYINAFFSSSLELAEGVFFDTVVHSHTFEHMYDPFSFLSDVASRMNVGQKMLFSVPDLENWVANHYLNSLNFEHTFYFNKNILRKFLELSGFELLETRNFNEGHSIFVAAQYTGNRSNSLDISNEYQINRRLFENFTSTIRTDASELRSEIERLDIPVYIFGGHVFSQYLINVGLKSPNIYGILDNDSKKHGRRLYGTSLFVYDPKVILQHPNVIVVLRAGAYSSEIRSQLLEFNHPDLRII